MWIHLGLGGSLLLLVLDSVGAPVLAQSSTVVDRPDSGVILRPNDGERVPLWEAR
jgi:hypothetical protein